MPAGKSIHNVQWGTWVVIAILASCLVPPPSPGQLTDTSRWWRGNLHTHSLWSDGNDFPDMIAHWYRDRGYNFLALSDHNVLSQGQRWMDVDTIQERGGQSALEKYRAAFGDSWVERRTNPQTGRPQVRLKPLAEFRRRIEKQAEFLLIPGEEISDSVNGKPVHLNASNLKNVILPVGGDSVRQAISNNWRAASAQAAAEDRPILVHVNHPNFGWAVTSEDLTTVAEVKFFEVYNGHPAVNHLGNDVNPAVEQMWDIVNALRIGQLRAAPIYGLATDDSHSYHGRPGSHPGRGWVMVRAPQLAAEDLIGAMQKGDFYASSGVFVEAVNYDHKTRKLSLQIAAAPGANYRTDFIGTLVDFQRRTTTQLGADRQPQRATRVKSSEIGRVLASQSGVVPSYQLTGNELYVRAVVTSSQPHPDPSFPGQYQQAWTQPVGWRDRIE